MGKGFTTNEVLRGIIPATPDSWAIYHNLDANGKEVEGFSSWDRVVAWVIRDINQSDPIPNPPDRWDVVEGVVMDPDGGLVRAEEASNFSNYVFAATGEEALSHATERLKRLKEVTDA